MVWRSIDRVVNGIGHTYRAMLASMVVAIGCAGQEPSTPATHYYDVLGNTLEKLEPVYAKLQAFYGTSMPAQITLRYTDSDRSVFDPDAGTIGITVEHLSRTSPPPESTIAHESSHLALHALTHGASSLERFRFIDEGLAYILAARVTDDDAFRTKILAKAAAASQQRTIDFALVQAWNSYGSREAHAENPDAYAVAASFVFFLLDQGGEWKLREFLVELGRTSDLEAPLQKTYGMSRQEAESRWRDYLVRIKP